MNNHGSARTPAPPPATVQSCAHYHPSHNRLHVVQLALHEEVCFWAKKEPPFSDLSIHCSFITRKYIHCNLTSASSPYSNLTYVLQTHSLYVLVCFLRASKCWEPLVQPLKALSPKYKLFVLYLTPVSSLTLPFLSISLLRPSSLRVRQVPLYTRPSLLQQPIMING